MPGPRAHAGVGLGPAARRGPGLRARDTTASTTSCQDEGGGSGPNASRVAISASTASRRSIRTRSRPPTPGSRRAPRRWKSRGGCDRGDEQPARERRQGRDRARQAGWSSACTPRWRAAASRSPTRSRGAVRTPLSGAGRGQRRGPPPAPDNTSLTRGYHHGRTRPRPVPGCRARLPVNGRLQGRPGSRALHGRRGGER